MGIRIISDPSNAYIQWKKIASVPRAAAGIAVHLTAARN